MPYNYSGGTTSGNSIARGFALTVLFALIVLIILRYAYGSISISAGV